MSLDRLAILLRRLGRLAWAPYTLLVVVGLIAMLARDPVAETPRFSPPEPGEAAVGAVAEQVAGGHLAMLSFGAVARVSSYDWFRSHHPLFAIDGEPRPEGWMMWATAPDDRDGWLEIDFVEPVDVARVELDFVGTGRWPENALPDYQLACLQGGQPVETLDVAGNTEMKPSHGFACSGAEGLRVDFALRGEGEPFSIVRLYEIEVWGPDSDEVTP